MDDAGGLGRARADDVASGIVVGHADWYAGNTAVSKGVLVGTF
ncbi:MAG TPA: hypothetical protein VIL68_01180 [Propionibacteriaceae bacterium]